MAHRSVIHKLAQVAIGMVLVCVLCSCSAEHYKGEADKQVYEIIDQKWDDDFGAKANYKISDTPASPNDVLVEKAVPASGVLSLTGAVALATAHNRQYQLEKEILYLRSLDLTLIRHEYAPNFFGIGSAQYAKDTGGEAVGSNAEVGFNQFLSTGADITTKVGLAWVEFLTGDMRSGLASFLNATVTQPLLRGSGRKVAMENLTQAERNALYQLRTFSRFRKEFVVAIVSQYYRVLQNYDTLKHARDNYNTLVGLHERMQKLKHIGRLPQFELDQARQDMLQARDTFVQTQKQYHQLLDEFKIELSLPADVPLQLEETELRSLNVAASDELDFSETNAIETALEQRLDLVNRADAIVDAKRKVEVVADSLRAELNLIGSAETTSRKQTNINMLSSLDNRYSLGLELDLPLDRLAERNAYRMALITLTRRQREHEEASHRVMLEVRQAYRDLIEAAERRRIQLESLALAQKRFDNTNLLLQYSSRGNRRANTRDVLDAQEDLFAAKVAASEALVDHAVATLDFYRDSGVLEVRPDGMYQY